MKNKSYNSNFKPRIRLFIYYKETYLIVIKFKFHFLYFWLLAVTALGQNTEKIKIQVRAINGINGTELPEAKISVKYSLSDNAISPKKEKKDVFYEIVQGADINISVEANAFYTETKRYETAKMYDAETIDIRLTPKPTNREAIVTIVDVQTKQQIPGKVKLSIGRNTTLPYEPKDRLVIGTYSEKGLKIEVEADGYISQTFTDPIPLSENDSEVVLQFALERKLITQKIVVLDKATQKPVSGSSLVVTSLDNKPVGLSAQLTFQTAAGLSYKAEVTHPDYEPLHQTFVSGQNNVVLNLTPVKLGILTFKTVDATSKKEIEGKITITSPTGKSTILSNSKNYQATEKGSHKVVVEAADYDKFEIVVVGDKDLETVVNLQRKLIEKSIIALDKETKEPINNVVIRLYSDTSKEIQGVKERNKATFKVNPDNTYFYEVSSPGYLGLTENLGNSQNSTALLTKIVTEKFQEHDYTLVDALTNTPVTKGQLVLLDQDKKSVETLFNAAKGTYQTFKISPTKKYTIQASANGYQDVTIGHDNNTKSIKILMQPSDLQEVVISIYDEYSTQMLEGKLSILLEGKEIPLTERNREYLAKLSAKYKYTVIFGNPDYKKYSKEIQLDQLTDNRFNINLRKENYPLALAIQNKLTQDQKKEAKIKISTPNGKNIPATLDFEKTTFRLESDPNDPLQVEINVPGFHPYLASNNRKQLAMYEIKVTLLPLPETPEPETVAEVVEQPPVIEKVVEEAPKIETKQEAPLEAKKGKKYLLTGVNFEQSSTKMLYGSELKLNELLTFMNQNPTVKIEIIGHTDKIGDERQNQRLSEFRAKTIANWLFNKGIETDRISVVGMGSKEPIAANDSEVTKAQNRRIEVNVIEE